MCGCTSCTENVLNSIADGHSCKGRIQWVIENYEYSESEACKLVADEYPSICGTCHSEHCGSFPPSPTPPPVSGMSLKVMSYNTEYTGYWDGRFDNFAGEHTDHTIHLTGSNSHHLLPLVHSSPHQICQCRLGWSSRMPRCTGHC